MVSRSPRSLARVRWWTRTGRAGRAPGAGAAGPWGEAVSEGPAGESGAQVMAAAYLAARRAAAAPEKLEKKSAAPAARQGGKYAAFAAKKTDFRALAPNPDADPQNPFFGKAVVFTGDLALPRAEAAVAVSQLGASVKSSVSRHTDYLVVGMQDAALVGAKGCSTKEQKAVQLNESGKAEIKVLDEPQFMALLAGAKGK